MTRKTTLLCVFVLVALFVANSIDCSAMIFLPLEDPWAEATNGMLGIVSDLKKLIRVVIGLGGIVILGVIVVRIMSGDKESARKLAWWLLGLAFGFIMLSIL